MLRMELSLGQFLFALGESFRKLRFPMLNG